MHKNKVYILPIVLLLCYFNYTYAEYPYESVCPTPAGGRYSLQDDVDQWNFWKCECVSYAAYMLNAYGIKFTNSFKDAYWSDGGNWNDAASEVSGQNIVVDDYPIPGDIAYWEYNWTGDPENEDDDWGHVAFVERVHFDSNGNAINISISEYNFQNRHDFGERTIPADDPSGFIHILAYFEGISHLLYLDSYEMNNLVDFQTKEEWEWILQRVWNDYRCQNCNSEYSSETIASLTEYIGGLGGGGSGPIDPIPESDLHITSVKGGLASEEYDDMNHSITETLFPGQCVKTSFIARYVNEADQEAKDVDFDWRADQNRARFDEDDDKLCDENREDVDPGEKNKKTFNNANLCVSSDGKKLTLTGPDGSISSEFQFYDEGLDKVAKIYVFADVEEKGRDNGDHDISSESKRDEYVKIEVTLGEDPSQGWVSVSNSPLISPQPIIIGKDFSITVSLKETKGLPKTFDKVAIAILSPDGSAFDFSMYDNVSIEANATWTKTATNYIYDSRPPGTYQVMVRGNIGGGTDGWFDFDTTGGGVNPAYFNVYRMGDEAPAAPSNLQSSTVTKNSIRLSWKDNSSNEEGFRIDRSENNTDWGTIATPGTNTTGFEDSGLKANTTYYYRVLAYNSGGASSWSGVLEKKTLSNSIIPKPVINIAPILELLLDD